MMLVLVGVAADAQPVVSARAGLIYHVEGAVSAAGEPLDPDSPKLVQLRPGETLVTEHGFAEMSLGPDRVLRIAPASQVELVRDDIQDAEILLRRGAVFVDWDYTKNDAGVTVRGADAAVRIRKTGLYRFDIRDGRARLRVYAGKAYPQGAPRVRKGRQADLLALSAEQEKFDLARRDLFDRWNARRARAGARAARAGGKRRRRGPPRGRRGGRRGGFGGSRF